VNDDIEAWLLFAPFWVLGLTALMRAVWHAAHAARVARRAQAAGHVRKTSLFSRRLAWYELTDEGRHHRGRALITVGAFVVLCLLGIGVAAAMGLLVGR
jgi:hypothetical protein